MPKRKTESFSPQDIHFVSEKIGDAEDDLKRALAGFFESKGFELRAYLANVVYAPKNSQVVAVCLASNPEEKHQVKSGTADIFRSMFDSEECLDIFFVTHSEETELRKVCCPFFSSRRFPTPDFYLSSSEGYGLEQARACFKYRRLHNGHPDGYMVCETVPPIIGQALGLGGEDVDKIVLASRHRGISVFNITEWPIYVHVARLTSEADNPDFRVTKGDLASIGWGEIYEHNY